MMSREEKAIQLETEMKEEERRVKVHKWVGIFLKIFFALIALGIGIFLYMRYVGTSGLKVHEFKIVNESLPSSFHGFKIAHFTDLHYGSTYQEKEVANLTKKINELKPDLIVFTGDLIDRDATVTEEQVESLILSLKGMSATTKKYAIKGNHDYKDDRFETIFQKAGFEILDNEGELLYYEGYTPIFVAGIGSGIKGDANTEQAFSYYREETANKELFSLFFLHEPDLLDTVVDTYPIDLVLSGHSHLGQVRLPGFSTIKTIQGARKYKESHYTVRNTELYISGGLGTTTYKLRFFNRPAINFYRLVEK